MKQSKTEEMLFVICTSIDIALADIIKGHCMFMLQWLVPDLKFVFLYMFVFNIILFIEQFASLCVYKQRLTSVDFLWTTLLLQHNFPSSGNIFPLGDNLVAYQ